MISRRSFATGVAGAGLALAGTAVFEAGRYVRSAAPASVRAEPKTLTVVPIDPSWVMSGTPQISMDVTSSTSDGGSASGVWVCEGPATFEWRFGMDETVHLLEGQVDIEYRNRRFTLRPGDSATFHAGTRAVWHVPVRIKKMFTLHRPGTLVRLWRLVTPAQI